MPDREKVVAALGEIAVYYRSSLDAMDDGTLACEVFRRYAEAAENAIAMLKAQEPVKPILARGWYWCGGIGCRYSLTSALEDDIPARKPNYCERCGRAVKWDG